MQIVTCVLYWINLLKYVLVLTKIEREPAMDCYLDDIIKLSNIGLKWIHLGI